MNPIKTALHKLKVKMFVPDVARDSLKTWNPRRTSLFGRMTSDAYASVYPSIHAIASEYKTVRPFAIDKNGKPIDHPAVTALYHPNQSDSSIAFQEKIAVSTLCLRKTYILVWRREGREAKPGGDFTHDQIAGYTFLEFPAITRRDDRTIYNIGAQEFTEDEVIVLPGGVDPNNLYAGYSPSEASRRWAKLDDYIADYQAGFFENGAIPAGQFIITSSSKEDFNDTVDKLQESHRGAGQNNNVTYTPRPVDPQSGKPADSKIEWIPFSQSNKEIDFKNLFEQTNKRIDLAYGVPQIVKGVDDAATYANAQVAERGFSKRAVFPLLLANYTQFTHELNRITNGFGASITFDYDIPHVSDELKVDAETKQVEMNTVNLMTDRGYSLDSVIDALQLSQSYKRLKMGDSKTTIDNPKPDVDEGDEVNTSPDPDKIDGITPVNKRKKGEAKSKNPKAEKSDKERIEDIAEDLMRSQVARAVAELKEEVSALVEPTENELQDFIVAMMAVVTTILVANGISEYEAGAKIAGISLEELQGFMLTDTAKGSYEAYLRRVGTSYGNDTAESIRKVLSDADKVGLNRRETEDKLRDIMDSDEWRVKRLARTELNNSQNIGQLEGMKSLSDETNTDWEKTINHTKAGICPLCQSQEGVWTPLDQALWEEGAVISTVNDKDEQIIYVNDWQTIQANDYHPNGTGSLIFRRVLV